MSDDYNNSFKVISDEGIEVTCDILFTFDWPESGKSYIVYTDNSRDEDGNVQVFASIYNPRELEGLDEPTGDGPRLIPIETEQEWRLVESILDDLSKQIESLDEEEEE